ncbi:ureidoglycolate hydrolase-like [Malus sylvestris]|uniref:ureidoglycolate hydrolase-like n=1 Tax=Malus sylvestris TaxID=3752 RepID=UPI0021AC90CD|nr:ureidoglycolate hydrolase-like [Malus sylvestris]
MEDFSGYPINESHSTFHITLSSPSVDTQSLQNFAILYRACISFLDAAGSAGYNKHEDDLLSVFLKKGCYSGFVELHIEQGPILEEEGVSIGIVTAIAASASIKVEFEGNGGHAGAVLMPNRNDAGLAAAELALAVERHVLESGSVEECHWYVGILELHPGAINSIPSKSHLEIDTRY